jgi:hypothetical protein
MKLFSKSTVQTLKIPTETEAFAFLQIFLKVTVLVCTKKKSTKNLCEYDKECFSENFQF